jgi:hypothetical protein
MGRNVAIAVSIAAVFAAGCARYDAGNRDRANCGALRSGMTAEEVTTQMGKPREVRRGEGEEVWVYSLPSMPDLPMLAEDKEVELVLAREPAGVKLQEARCSGVDG